LVSVSGELEDWVVVEKKIDDLFQNKIENFITFFSISDNMSQEEPYQESFYYGRLFIREWKINFSRKTLKNFDPSGIDLTKIHSVNLYHCKIKVLPDWIGQCVNLKTLMISHNPIYELPTWIGNLVNLTYLSAYQTRLTSLPEEIGNLTKLEDIHIQSNHLKTLPSSIGKLVSLKELDVTGWSFHSLPLEIGNLTKLKKLSVNFSILKTIPKEIGNMTELKSLTFLYCHVSSIPSEVGKLTKLTELLITSRELEELPSEIGSLTSLKFIYLSHCRLSSLPETMKNLVNMESFHIPCNKFKTLPPWICNWVRLEKIFYANNPIEYVPPQVTRFLARLEQPYGDKQSVHNSAVQKSFIESVQRLTVEKPEFDSCLLVYEFMTSSLSKESKLDIMKYSTNNEIHSAINMTYFEVFTFVWSRIRVHPNMDDILKVLDQEIKDSKNMCFTGRITRVVNCLNGFDPDVVIHISNNEQLNNLSTIIRKKFPEMEDQKKALKEAMEERGFSQEDIAEWVEYL
jgi:Leucine-rich repeat (LRR) protein